MHKAIKKVYISILTICLVFVTVIATTYAWVGILTYSSTSNFELNLKTQDLGTDYYLSISATGEDNDFSDTANSYRLKQQILENMGILAQGKYSDDDIETSFLTHSQLNTVTSDTIIDDKFYELDYDRKDCISNKISKSFYKFDIYLSLEHRNGDDAIQVDMTNCVDVALYDIENTLQGNTITGTVANGITYPTTSLSITPNFPGVSASTVKANSASAARIALAIYDPILRNETYSGTEEPSMLYIFQGGTQNPTYDEINNTYSFGGVLPEEYNLALKEYKSIHRLTESQMKIPDSILNRGDMELTENNRLLFDDTFGFGIVNGHKTKMKITIYFWFEGWDADAFEILDGIDTKISLNFSTGNQIF